MDAMALKLPPPFTLEVLARGAVLVRLRVAMEGGGAETLTSRGPKYAANVLLVACTVVLNIISLSAAGGQCADAEGSHWHTFWTRDALGVLIFDVRGYATGLSTGLRACDIKAIANRGHSLRYVRGVNCNLQQKNTYFEIHKVKYVKLRLVPPQKVRLNDEYSSTELAMH